MAKTFYITTTLPYVNAAPHIGFALEAVQADVIARYKKLQGYDVFYNTGTDEHGLKVYRKANELGLEVQVYTDECAQRFKDLVSLLNLDTSAFIRTTDDFHVAAAQAFWQACEKNGDIYKKMYSVKYCVGCELEKTDSELEDGVCPVHPNLAVELIEEENYFFRFSNYQEKLLALYDANPTFVVPSNRQQEIRNFVAAGLQDFSISRLKKKMPWGVPVPGDDGHVMYVWFDALVNYISTVGWPNDEKTFAAYWPGAQVAGKDNLRQQTAMWQAMLLSAGLPNSTQVFIHGFITSEGEKMSKSRGNVVDPVTVVEKYGLDPVRFYLLGAIPSYDDGDFSEVRFQDFYTAHLANGVGNLTSRVVTMLEKYVHGKVPDASEDSFDIADFWNQFDAALEAYQFERAVEVVNALVGKIDKRISDEKPWEKAKAGEDITPLLYALAEALRHVGLSLLPIIPESAEKLLSALGIDASSLPSLSETQVWGGLASGSAVTKGDPLFPRL